MTATAAEPIVITEPGMYPDLDEKTYHRDPVPGGSLSVSGAKKLLAPSCPARYRYDADHPVHKPEFDFGQAAHLKVLGRGGVLDVIDAPDYKTKAARESRDAAYAGGRIPILVGELVQVEAMADAIREHPIASILLDPACGAPEQSGFWFDDEFGVWRRVRFDWLPHPSSNGRLILTDYKSAASAEPSAFGRAAANFGYHMQDDWYRDGARALGLGGDDTALVFVVQEKTPPYLVTVCELDEEAREIGRARNRRALEIYRDCAATRLWPGYSQAIETVSLPRWAHYQHIQEEWS